MPAIPLVVHLYLHVPFCARRCSYCDFAIAVRRETPSGEYVDRVLAEWGRWRGEPPWSDFTELATIYLGGGTPSRLDPASLERLLDALRSDRPLAAGGEVTLEANPEDVTSTAAAGWRRAGVNRVSLGVQSFEPAVLAWMHRTHEAAQVPRAVATLREAGIRNISLDLIYSLPPDLSRDWSRDLDQALALEPEHLSLYGLTVESGTPLGRWVARGDAHLAPEERYADEFLRAHETLTAAGFRHYEVSNYGRQGFRAVHNTAYWRRAPYLGLGPSAHSAVGTHRWWNIREWREWSLRIGAGGTGVAGEEVLDSDAVRIEDIYLGLRTDQGIPEAVLPPSPLAAWRAEGWAVVEAGQVRLTPEGWLRLDALVAAASVR